MRVDHFVAAAVFFAFSAAPVFAEFAKVDDQASFVALISGKELKRPFVNLEVAPDGGISGRGAAWAVTGNWTWNDGFFCREIYWGGDALGYNCQEVQATGDRIKFTSDRGQGDSAEFRLR